MDIPPAVCRRVDSTEDCVLVVFIVTICDRQAFVASTVFDANNIDGNGPDIYKMYTYSKEPEKIPFALDFYKENDDDVFE